LGGRCCNGARGGWWRLRRGCLRRIWDVATRALAGGGGRVFPPGARLRRRIRRRAPPDSPPRAAFAGSTLVRRHRQIRLPRCGGRRLLGPRAPPPAWRTTGQCGLPATGVSGFLFSFFLFYVNIFSLRNFSLDFFKIYFVQFFFKLFLEGSSPLIFPLKKFSSLQFFS